MVDQWEKELRLLSSLSRIIMPSMGAPTGIIDTSARIIDPGEREAVRHSRRWIDPADRSIHFYVRAKYLAPLIQSWAASQPPPQTERPTRVYPAQFISPEQFESGGAFAWPYKNAREVLQHVDEVVRSQLKDWRAHPDSFERSIPQTPPLSLSKTCRAWLIRLAGLKVDVARFYWTFKHSGDSLLQASSFYEEVERRRHGLRNEIRRDKQSLRVHLRYWKPRCDPGTFESLQRNKEEIFNSLDLIYQPTEQMVRKYRRRLGVSPRRGHPIFWTPLICWAVQELEDAGLTKLRAFRAVAALFHEGWPTIHRNNVRAVKARYYRAR